MDRRRRHRNDRRRRIVFLDVLSQTICRNTVDGPRRTSSLQQQTTINQIVNIGTICLPKSQSLAKLPKTIN
jgi:hypothetical protein